MHVATIKIQTSQSLTVVYILPIKWQEFILTRYIDIQNIKDARYLCVMKDMREEINYTINNQSG